MIRYHTILKRKALYRKIGREMLWQNAQKVENVVAFLYSCHKIWADFMVLSENSLGTVYFVCQKLYNMYYTMKIKMESVCTADVLTYWRFALLCSLPIIPNICWIM